jgi:divalent metal cation (Fe/Co/Zn/Cd) transporter
MRIERKYWPVWVLIAAMFFAWSAWGIVYNNISPFASPQIAFPLFYLTAFLSVSLTFFTFDVFLRIAFMPHKTVLYHVYASLRQGVIFGLVFLGAMAFQQFHILNWWIASMIVAMGILFEAVFWNQK